MNSVKTFSDSLFHLPIPNVIRRMVSWKTVVVTFQTIEGEIICKKRMSNGGDGLHLARYVQAHDPKKLLGGETVRCFKTLDGSKCLNLRGLLKSVVGKRERSVTLVAICHEDRTRQMVNDGVEKALYNFNLEQAMDVAIQCPYAAHARVFFRPKSLADKKHRLNPKRKPESYKWVAIDLWQEKYSPRVEYKLFDAPRRGARLTTIYTSFAHIAECAIQSSLGRYSLQLNNCQMFMYELCHRLGVNTDNIRSWSQNRVYTRKRAAYRKLPATTAWYAEFDHIGCAMSVAGAAIALRLA